jgi:hypothetical protein
MKRLILRLFFCTLIANSMGGALADYITVPFSGFTISGLGIPAGTPFTGEIIYDPSSNGGVGNTYLNGEIEIQSGGHGFGGVAPVIFDGTSASVSSLGIFLDKLPTYGGSLRVSLQSGASDSFSVDLFDVNTSRIITAPWTGVTAQTPETVSTSALLALGLLPLLVASRRFFPSAC